MEGYFRKIMDLWQTAILPTVHSLKPSEWRGTCLLNSSVSLPSAQNQEDVMGYTQLYIYYNAWIIYIYLYTRYKDGLYIDKNFHHSVCPSATILLILSISKPVLIKLSKVMMFCTNSMYFDFCWVIIWAFLKVHQ